MLFLRFTEFYAQNQETANLKCKNHAVALFFGGGGNPNIVTAENYTAGSGPVRHLCAFTLLFFFFSHATSSSNFRRLSVLVWSFSPGGAVL